MVIARYGKVGDGQKVSNAQLEGAIGVLLYPDPEEVAKDGSDMQNVAPNNWWLPSKYANFQLTKCARFRVWSIFYMHFSKIHGRFKTEAFL